MSNCVIGPDAVAGPRFGFSVGAVMRAYRGWRLHGGPGGTGYQARRRNGKGREYGPRVTGRSLDALAEQIDAESAGE